MYLGIIPKDDSIFQRVQEHIDTENLDDYDFPTASTSSKKDDSEELEHLKMIPKTTLSLQMIA